MPLSVWQFGADLTLVGLSGEPGGTPGQLTSALCYRPQYFLINGAPYRVLFDQTTQIVLQKVLDRKVLVFLYGSPIDRIGVTPRATVNPGRDRASALPMPFCRVTSSGLFSSGAVQQNVVHDFLSRLGRVRAWQATSSTAPASPP